MKYLVSILLIIASLGVKAQSYTPESHRQFPFIKIDSAAVYTPGDTVGRGSVAGAIKFKSSDHSFYYHNGTSWRPFVTDSLGMIARLNDKVDSLTLASDILYYWKVGVGYGVTLPIGTDSAYVRIGAPDDSTLVFYRFNGDSTVVSVNTVPSGGGSMTWPATAGLALYSGSSSWGTSVTDNSANWNTVLNRVLYTDTASMLANYQTQIFQRVKISDTASMLTNYKHWLAGYIKTDGWFNIVRDGGADTTGTNDVSSIIQGALNAGIKNILIPHGQFKISTTVQLKDSVTINGLGNSTVIKLVTDIPAFKISLALGGNLSKIERLLIKGTYSTGASTAQDGILLDSAYGFTANNVFGHNLGGAGFHFMNNGYCCVGYTVSGMRGNFINSPYVDSSYAGVIFDNTAEYNQINGGTLTANLYGYKNSASGNDMLTGVNISSNTHGFYIEGGGNDGHGTATGCIINHNTEPLYISGVTRGYYFGNCNIWGSLTDSTRIKNSDRIQFNGGYFTPRLMAWTDNTNCTLSVLDDLLGTTSAWTIVGTPPTIFKLGAEQTINKPLSYSYNINGSLTGNNLITKSWADSLLLKIGDTTNYMVRLADSWGINITGTMPSRVLSVDSFNVASRAYAIKVADSMSALRPTPPLQDVLTAGSTLTTTNTINGGGNDLSMGNFGNFFATSRTGSYLGTNGSFSSRATTVLADNYSTVLKTESPGGTNGSYLYVYKDSIMLQPQFGNLYSDTLTHSLEATDKMMVWDSVTKRIATRLIPTGGGGGSGVTSVATNNATGITGGTITSTGTLALDTAYIVETKANNIRRIDSTTNANTFTFRKTTTDYAPVKYVGGSTLTFKGDRPDWGLLIDSTSVGDSVRKWTLDTATVSGKYLRITDTTNYSPRINTGFGLTASGSAPTLVLTVDTSHSSTGITTWNDVARTVDSLGALDEFNQQITYADAGGGTTMTVTGGAITATGTGTAVAVGTGSNYANKTRLEYLVAAAATTAVAGWRQATTKYFLGNTAGQGGFYYTCYFGNATGAATTTTRCFVGMQSSTAAPTDVEPSTLLNMFGVGWDAADGNLQFFNNDGTGTATKTDLGASFTVPTTDRSVGYKLTLYSAPNSSVVSYTLKHLNTGATASGSVSSDLPANTLFLGGRGYMSVGGTSSVIGIALIKQYIKSQLD